MGLESLSRRLLGGAVALIVLSAPRCAGSAPAAGVAPPPPGNTLRASSARMLQQDSATGGTPAPANGLSTMPTPAPALTPELAPNSKCSNGFPGVESVNGKTCCKASCVECGGVGCSSRGNSSDCCATEISLLSEECGIAGEAPCFIVPPQPWEPENTMVYFALFVIIPFLVVAALCNYSLFPCCRDKEDPDTTPPATTEHVPGHKFVGSALLRRPRSATPADPAQAEPPAVEAGGGGASTL